MENKNYIPLKITIGLIVFYWIYSLLSAFTSEQVVPPTVIEVFQKIIFLQLGFFALVFLLMKFGSVRFSDLGMGRDNMSKSIWIGAGWGLLAFVFINIGLNSLLQVVLPDTAETNGVDMTIYFEDSSYLIVWILLGIFGGGFVEELERIFVLTRFEDWMGKYGLYLALGVNVLVFAMGHLYQGTSGAISAGVSGLIFALVYLRKRSGIEAIACHATFDVVGIVIGHMMVG